MSNVTAISNNSLTERQMLLVKQTVASDCNEQEFNLFMEAAKAYGLDPFRKQIMAMVFSKKNPEKRRMAIVVGIDGQRILAQRSGDYRPAEEPASCEIDETLKCPANPHGIVSCSVTLRKQDNRGEWYPVSGQAFWEEFAPVKEEWAYSQEEGKRRPTGNFTLDGTWARMPRLMIAKCATMQALRAGWPDQFGGIYTEEEMHQAQAQDANASDLVAQAEEERRLNAVAANNAITVSWMAGMPLENVPVGQFADRVAEWLADPSHDHTQVEDFREVNRVALQEFWAMQPGDALELKKKFEQTLVERTPAVAAG